MFGIALLEGPDLGSSHSMADAHTPRRRGAPSDEPGSRGSPENRPRP